VIYECIDPDKPYTFGEDQRIYEKFHSLGLKHISESMSLVFPRDIIFIDRTFGGHFGNLCRLNAAADWRSLIAGYATPPLN
jgi:hypothetical protein